MSQWGVVAVVEQCHAMVVRVEWVTEVTRQPSSSSCVCVSLFFYFVYLSLSLGLPPLNRTNHLLSLTQNSCSLHSRDGMNMDVAGIELHPPVPFSSLLCLLGSPCPLLPHVLQYGSRILTTPHHGVGIHSRSFLSFFPGPEKCCACVKGLSQGPGELCKH